MKKIHLQLKRFLALTIVLTLVVSLVTISAAASGIDALLIVRDGQTLSFNRERLNAEYVSYTHGEDIDELPLLKRYLGDEGLSKDPVEFPVPKGFIVDGISISADTFANVYSSAMAKKDEALAGGMTWDDFFDSVIEKSFTETAPAFTEPTTAVFEVSDDGVIPALPTKVVDATGAITDATKLDQLNGLIKQAEVLLKDIAVSADGSDIDRNKYWVSDEALLTTLTNAVTAAKAITDPEDTNLDNAIGTLVNAIASVNNAKQLGTKPLPTDPTEATLVAAFIKAVQGATITTVEDLTAITNWSKIELNGDVTLENLADVVTAIKDSTATTWAALAAEINVVIAPPVVDVTGVTLNETTAALVEGDTLQLTATVLPEDATNKAVTWSTSNPDIATVDESGLVTAVAAGTATITVTTVDGDFTATCEVAVTAPAPTAYKVEAVKDDIGGVLTLKVLVTIIDTEKPVERVVCYDQDVQGAAGQSVYPFLITSLTEEEIDNILETKEALAAWAAENVEVIFKEPIRVDTLIDRENTGALKISGMITLFVYLKDIEGIENASVYADGNQVFFDAYENCYVAGIDPQITTILVRVEMPDFTYDEFTVDVISV